jgi:hypothetical protein
MSMVALATIRGDKHAQGPTDHAASEPFRYSLDLHEFGHADPSLWQARHIAAAMRRAEPRTIAQGEIGF